MSSMSTEPVQARHAWSSTDIIRSVVGMATTLRPATRDPRKKKVPEIGNVTGRRDGGLRHECVEGALSIPRQGLDRSIA